MSRARWSSSRSNLSAQSRSCSESHVAALASDVGESRARRHLPCWLRVMSDARSSTLRCREIAGRLIEKGAASSVTVASPSGESLDDAPAGGVGERTEEQVEILARPFRLDT